MKTYTVNCEWDPTGWWVITVPDVPGAISQARRLDQVDPNVGEIIKLMTGKKVGTYRTDLHWTVPGPGRAGRRGGMPATDRSGTSPAGISKGGQGRRFPSSRCRPLLPRHRHDDRDLLPARPADRHGRLTLRAGGRPERHDGLTHGLTLTLTPDVRSD